jgi:hypothetical protein
MAGKLMTMQALQQTLSQHINQGGTFTVLTPSYIYVDALLSDLRDVSGQNNNGQPQVEWQWDFEQPLVSAQAAQSQQNGLISKITSGAAIGGTPTWSFVGLASTNPVNLIVNSLAPTPAEAPTINSVLTQ